MLETGVPNLDLILGGGILEGDVLLVVGPPGSGKTTLTLQLAFHTAGLGQNVLYLSTVSEPPTRLVRHVSSFSFCDESLIGKRLFLMSLYPLVKRSLGEVTDGLIQAVKENQATLAIIDGLTSIRDLHPEEPELRSFIYELGATLSTLDCTLVLTSSEAEGPGGRALPEFTMADGVVELGLQNLNSRTARTIRARKMRGLAPLLGQHALRIDDSGLTVLPRLESLFRPPDLGLSGERVPLGLPELDKMMLGGVAVGSATVLSGALGTGKTLACLQFIGEGARRGEKSLFFGFRETQRLLIDKARVFGIDLESAVKDGRVVISSYPQVDLDVDAITWEMWRTVERFAPQRLALDSIAELEWAILDDRRRRGYMAALSGLLRGKGVTSLITKEISRVVGPELDFSDTPLAVLAENLLLLRHVEFRGELYRVLSIIKMRDSDHDHSIRQYTITDKGIVILAPIETAEGVLTGIARLAPGTRGRRMAAGAWREEGS